ncbi:signal peptide peptidase SppA [Maricurvus nonylphenolicus]|uniref:signal peptide peptidase SppA n=1 Tax=Maricurvus nonylphenolicus TaxID=1008307 RepID=UPI0036F216EA
MSEQKKPGFIRRTFGFVWSLLTWLRTTTFNLLFLVIILAIIVSLSDEDTAVMPDSTALRIAPSGFLVDQRSYVDPMTQFLEQSSPEDAETLVRDLTTSLTRAAEDKRITALVLDLSNLYGGGISKLEEIGQALQTFKASGKQIYAVSDNYSQDQYYLASYADTIYLNPMGAVLLTGYGSYRNYFKSALDKLDMNFHVFRVGEYKDAVEPFLQDHMSDASREHNQLWLTDLWQTYHEQVEQQRGLTPDTLNDYINNLDQHMAANAGDSATLAKTKGLVDELASRHRINQHLREALGEDDNGGYDAIDYWDYLDFTDREQPQSADTIGLLIAKGAILDGQQPEGTIGGDTLAALIEDAREDSDIKALVIRVDSPGGSAFASEVIREQLNVTREAGIPIVVSMGSVAASGGYWIAMGADEVWATPTTITGSIGVFSAFPTVENTLGRLGISTDGVGTTKLAGALRIDRPLSPLASNVLQQSVDNIYQRFLTIVADARQSTPEQIHTVAQGRVWTGTAAQELGLVDNLGTLEDAIAAAAAKAELTDYQVEEVRKALTPGEQLLLELSGGMVSIGEKVSASWQLPAFWQQAIAPVQQQLQLLQQMNDPQGVYAQCLECAGVH